MTALASVAADAISAASGLPPAHLAWLGAVASYALALPLLRASARRRARDRALADVEAAVPAMVAALSGAGFVDYAINWSHRTTRVRLTAWRDGAAMAAERAGRSRAESLVDAARALAEAAEGGDPPRPRTPPSPATAPAAAPGWWWAELGLRPGAGRRDIDAAWRAEARARHPDAGGSHAAMSRLNEARDAARREAGDGAMRARI